MLPRPFFARNTGIPKRKPRDYTSTDFFLIDDGYVEATPVGMKEEQVRQLAQTIPDVEALLLMEPEELGAHMLFLLKKEYPRPENFLPRNLISELAQSQLYPVERDTDVSLAVSEALSWLEAQGLFVADPKDRGGYGWRVLSAEPSGSRATPSFNVSRWRDASQRTHSIPHSAIRFGPRS
jgi:hypothetical protein